jgi:hypothetical protein
MSPIVVTNSSPASHLTRVAVPPPGVSGDYPYAPLASPLFNTSFEGAAEGPNVTSLNVAGVFTFEPPNATRITNANPALDPQGVAQPLGMGVTSIDGQKFLRFRYQPSTTPDNPWSEQRWYVDPPNGPYVNAKREMWAQWWVFFGTNFHNRQDDSGSRHKKFAAFWNTSYSSTASQTVVVFELWPEIDPATGTDTKRSFLRASTNSYASSSVQQRATYSNAVNNNGTGAIELGRWQRIRVHLKRSSTPGALDGVMQVYVGDTLAINSTNLSLWSFNDPTTTHDYWRAGYLMGEATRGYQTSLSDGADIRIGIDGFGITFTNPAWP